MMRIESLSIKSFKGIKENNIDLDGKSLLIFGENGTGKSSITDAVKFALTKDSNQLKSTEEYATHLKSKKEDLDITINYNENCKIQKTLKKTKYSNHKEFKEYLLESQNGSFILNRAKMLEFITSNPSERYEAIGNLVGLKKYQEIQEKLEKNWENFKNEVKALQKEKEFKIETTGKLIGREINSEKDLKIAINEILNDKNLKEIDFKQSNEKIIQYLVETGKKVFRTNYREILNLFDSIKIYNDSYENYDKIKKILKNTDNIDKTHLQNLIIEQIKINSEILGVLDYLSEEIKSNKNIEHLSRKVTHYVNEFENQNDYLMNLYKLNLDVNNSYNYNIVKKLKKDIVKIHKEIEKQSNLKEDRVNRRISLILNNIISSLIALEDIEKTEKRLEIAKKRESVSKAIFDNFKMTKYDLLRRKYKKIQDDINAFYSYIHEDESIVDLKLKSDNKDEIYLKITYLNNENDPRAYSSEGHLDTLSLCIFLAFIKNYNKKCSLIVLDDIVSTLDILHKERIARLLFENFSDKQFIITTHDKVWYNQMINIERIYGLKEDFKNLEITGWNIDYGPQLSSYIPYLEQVEYHLSKNQLHCAANEGRRFIEYHFEQLCRANRVPVQIKDNYTIGDLRTPVLTRIRKTTKRSEFEEYYINIIDNLEKTIILGNLLSHNTPESETCSKNEVKSFCEAVHTFMESVTCDRCGSYLFFDNQSKSIICPERRCKNTINLKK